MMEIEEVIKTKVYGRKVQFPQEMFSWSSEKQTADTHEAELVNIKETERLPCQHGSISYSTKGSQPVTTGKCQECGKLLVAKWEVVND